jgi:multidrug efflux pump subunit AcrB
MVVDPIEKKIFSLSDIKKVKSFIRDGLAVIQVDYNYDVNINDKYQELVREVNSLRSQLPTGIHAIDIQKASASDVNILQIALVSENASQDALLHQGENLQKALEKVPELKNVKLHGVRDRIVRIDLKLDKMAQLNIPATLVSNALQSEMTNIPGGAVYEGNRSYNIKTNASFSSLDDIQNTIVVNRGTLPSR